MIPLKQRMPVKRRFEFRSDAYRDPDTFAVVRMSGFESISRPYRFELVLVSDDANIDFTRVLAADAHLDILAPEDPARRTPYGGILAEFEQLHQAGGYTFYRAVLVPRLWRLSQHRSSEVYLHEQSVPQIIEQVLMEGGLESGLDYELRLREAYRARSSVCQYQETPLDFISRWLEKEGIYYHFEQVDGREKMVLLDARDTQSPRRLPVAYRPVDELDTGLAPDSIQTFSCRTRPMPCQVVLQEFNYRRASVPLVAKAMVDPLGIGEELIYGENFRSQEEGERYAAVRAQEILCSARVFHAESTAVGLRSGGLISLRGHYRSEFNSEFLVTEITHEGSQAGALLAGLKTPWAEREGEIAYRNNFVALDASRQFRPARITPKPRVAGTMSATIDAEGNGEYAQLDGFGQYRVQVPFDRSDKPVYKGSTAVRMASPYAGSDHGMHFPLHKGAEVLLSFADGDPDQPVIVGAVPNSVNPSVVKDRTQGQNLIQTAAGNVLRMRDKRGGQSVHVSTPFAQSFIHLGSLKHEDESTGGGHKEGGDDKHEDEKKISPEMKEEIEKSVKEEIEKKEAEKTEGKEEEEAGLFIQTLGKQYEITYGNEAKVNFGAKNDISVGQKNDWSASLATDIKLGFRVGVGASAGMEWKLPVPGLKTLDINDASDVEFVGQEHEKVVQKHIEFKAGIVDPTPGWLSVRVRMNMMRAAILAQSAGNMAEQMVIAKLIKDGGSFSRTGEAVGRFAGNLALFALMQYWARGTANILGQAPAVSQAKLDAHGVEFNVNEGGAPTEQRAVLSLQKASGITLRSELQSNWSTADSSQLSLSPTVWSAQGKTQLTMNAPTVALSSKDSQTKLILTDGGMLGLAVPSATLAMETGKVKAIAGQEVSIGVGQLVPNPEIKLYEAQLAAAAPPRPAPPPAPPRRHGSGRRASRGRCRA